MRSRIANCLRNENCHAAKLQGNAVLHGTVKVCSTSQQTVAQMNNSVGPKKGRMFIQMYKMLVKS